LQHSLLHQARLCPLGFGCCTCHVIYDMLLSSYNTQQHGAMHTLSPLMLTQHHGSGLDPCVAWGLWLTMRLRATYAALPSRALLLRRTCCRLRLSCIKVVWTFCREIVLMWLLLHVSVRVMHASVLVRGACKGTQHQVCYPEPLLRSYLVLRFAVSACFVPGAPHARPCRTAGANAARCTHALQRATAGSFCVCEPVCSLFLSVACTR
jgi:hypothetical protein